MDNSDGWLAIDKLQHFLFCFFLTIIFSLLSSHTPYSFLRNHNTVIGSILSLAAGAVKEVADEIGYFRSAGGSLKDAVFDLLGTIFGALLLYLFRWYSIRVGHKNIKRLDEVKEAEMV